MDVDAFLADSANAIQGRLYVLGAGWNTIWAATFPAIHPRVAIGILVRVPWTETNTMHRIAVRLDTEDGQAVQLGVVAGPQGQPVPVMQLGGQFNVGRPPVLVQGDEQTVALAMDVNQIPFEGPGMYNWVISIDDEPVKRLPMRVAPAAPQFGPIG